MSGTGRPGKASGPRGELRALALELPEAYEDFPWDETVIKVRNKIFVFLGTDRADGPGQMGVKLAESLDQASSAPGAAPMGYGLGKAGWVTVPLGEDAPPIEVLGDWIEESYRLVAPKRLAAQLDLPPRERPRP